MKINVESFLLNVLLILKVKVETVNGVGAVLCKSYPPMGGKQLLRHCFLNCSSVYPICYSILSVHFVSIINRVVLGQNPNLFVNECTTVNGRTL